MLKSELFLQSGKNSDIFIASSHTDNPFIGVGREDEYCQRNSGSSERHPIADD